MTANFDHDTSLDPLDVSGRNIWQRIDLLLSFAESQTSEANHDDPNSLLGALNYLRELETQIQRELDYAVIALKEFWRYSSRDISLALGTKWEHDRSDLLIAVPDNELRIAWRVAHKRYREALKRQFGPNTEVPSQEYLELYVEDICWRRRAMNPDEAPLPPRPEKDAE